MKIIAKISVFIFLLCQLTTSFANNPTTNIEPGNDAYIAVWFVQEGDVMVEMDRMELDAKCLNLQNQVDLDVVEDLFNIKEVTNQKGLQGKNAQFVVIKTSTLCSQEWLENYCLEVSGQCNGASRQLIPGWCIVLDVTSPCFGQAIYCNSIEL